MSTPKLFEFPGGEVLDLNELYAVSNIYPTGDAEQQQYHIRVYLRIDPDSQYEYYMGDTREKAAQEKRALIHRWASDK